MEFPTEIHKFEWIMLETVRHNLVTPVSQLDAFLRPKNFDSVRKLVTMFHHNVFLMEIQRSQSSSKKLWWKFFYDNTHHKPFWSRPRPLKCSLEIFLTDCPGCRKHPSQIVSQWSQLKFRPNFDGHLFIRMLDFPSESREKSIRISVTTWSILDGGKFFALYLSLWWQDICHLL